MFVLLPTGSGKSVCYYWPPRVFDFLRQQTALRESIVIVVSPLTSLVQGQVRVVIERNVTTLAHATFLSGLSFVLSPQAVCVLLVEERRRKGNS